MKLMEVSNYKSLNKKLEERFKKEYKFNEGNLIKQIIDNGYSELAEMLIDLPILPDQRSAQKFFKKYQIEVLFITRGLNHSEGTDKHGIYSYENHDYFSNVTGDYATGKKDEINKVDDYEILIYQEMESVMDYIELETENGTKNITSISICTDSDIEDKTNRHENVL